MSYELWDPETGNRVGTYRSERAALRGVADTARLYGADSREALSLGLIGPRGVIAEGRALVERALEAEAAAHRPRRPASPRKRAAV
jgi:hypothetical protein